MIFQFLLALRNTISHFLNNRVLSFFELISGTIALTLFIRLNASFWDLSVRYINEGKSRIQKDKVTYMKRSPSEGERKPNKRTCSQMEMIPNDRTCSQWEKAPKEMAEETKDISTEGYRLIPPAQYAFIPRTVWGTIY